MENEAKPPNSNFGTDVELGQSPRYSTIAPSPPSYFDVYTQNHLPPPLPPRTFEAVHFWDDCRPFHAAWTPNPTSNRDADYWLKQKQDRDLLEYRIQERKRSEGLGRVVRKALKLAVALLGVVALAIVLLLILLRVKGG